MSVEVVTIASCLPHCLFLYSCRTRYRASERNTIEFEDLVTAENRAVSLASWHDSAQNISQHGVGHIDSGSTVSQPYIHYTDFPCSCNTHLVSRHY